ncbi:MAG: outer membrane beta-barrel protein [Mesorhizobium sp.]|nr:outer membrane beta-barrel protein [Mesorhizobium sp.]
MRLSLCTALPIVLLGLAPSSGALAADYEPPMVIDTPEEYAPVEVGNGWYLRGDIGYALSSSANGNFEYRTFDPITATYGQSIFNTAALGMDLSYGFGVGYQYNEYIRGDLTLDAFSGRFDGTTVSASPCVTGDPAYVGTTCRSEDGAGFTAVSAMANGYVDLGTYAGFTPYVGAGAGVTHMSWGDLTSRTYCVGGVACPPPGGVITTTIHPGENSWRFTYAFMGGVAFDISRNLKLDVGYKYTRIAGGDMFGWDAGTAAVGATGVQGRDPGLSKHDVRVGLRYSLW